MLNVMWPLVKIKSKIILKLSRSPLHARLANGAMWTFLGTLITRGSGVVAMMLVARSIGKEGMGEYGMIQSTVGLFSSVASMGMGVTATKFVAEYKLTDRLRAGSMLGLSALTTWISGLALMAILYFSATWFATDALAAPHLGKYLQISSILLLLSAVNGAQTGALAGFEDFKAIAKVSLISAVITFPTTVLAALHWGLLGAIYALLISQFLNCVLSHLAVRLAAKSSNVPLWSPILPGQWKVLWQFSLPGLLCTMVLGPANWISCVLLVNTNNGYLEMGVYNATLNWINVVAFMPGIIAQVLLPILASQGDKDHSSTKVMIIHATKANFISVLPVVAILSLLSPLIMRAYGSEFSNGWPTLVATVMTAGVISLQSAFVQYVTASGHMWRLLSTFVLFGALTTIITIPLVQWGSFGMASARFLAALVTLVYTFWLTVKLMKDDSING